MLATPRAEQGGPPGLARTRTRLVLVTLFFFFRLGEFLVDDLTVSSNSTGLARFE